MWLLLNVHWNYQNLVRKICTQSYKSGKNSSTSLDYFRPCIELNNHNNQPAADQDIDIVSEIEHTQILLWVHQEIGKRIF